MERKSLHCNTMSTKRIVLPKVWSKDLLFQKFLLVKYADIWIPSKGPLLVLEIYRAPVL